MTFHVRWKKAAMDELISSWTDADSERRQAITAATHQIDELLARDPESQGESRPDDCRITFVPPLGILFRVAPKEATVWVARIWLY